MINHVSRFEAEAELRARLALYVSNHYQLHSRLQDADLQLSASGATLVLPDALPTFLRTVAEHRRGADAVGSLYETLHASHAVALANIVGRIAGLAVSGSVIQVDSASGDVKIHFAFGRES